MGSKEGLRCTYKLSQTRLNAVKEGALATHNKADTTSKGNAISQKASFLPMDTKSLTEIHLAFHPSYVTFCGHLQSR